MGCSSSTSSRSPASTVSMIRAGDLRAQFDAIILPERDAEPLLKGMVKDSGAARLRRRTRRRRCSRAGRVRQSRRNARLPRSGRRISPSTRSSCRSRTSPALPREQFFCPGSLVRIELDPTQPLAYGMPAQVAGVLRRRFGVRRAAGLRRVTTIARYAAKDVLVSGLLQGESRSSPAGPPSSRPGRRRPRGPVRIPRPASRAVAAPPSACSSTPSSRRARAVSHRCSAALSGPRRGG